MLDLVDAADDLMSNRFVLSDHHFTLAVYSDSLKGLRDNMSVARAALADTGMVAAREGAALEAAYWSQLVGNRSEERRVGKECVSRVDLGGRRLIKKKTSTKDTYYSHKSH